MRSILVVKLAEQGATVLAYPALRRAAEIIGRDNVYFLVFEENRFVVDVLGVMNPANVIALPTGGFWQFAVGLVKALIRLRRLRLDGAVDFEFFARGSAALTYLSGARLRAGLHGFGDGAPYRGDLMTHRLRYDPASHTWQVFSGLVESLWQTAEAIAEAGGRLPPGSPTLSWQEPAPFAPSPDETAAVRALLRRESRTDACSPLVLLNANASDLLPQRRWPAERYVELARRLIDGFSRVHVAFTGAPEESIASGQLAALVDSPRCFSLAGKTTLRELLVLYGIADLLVTNDSGPAHFAALTPIRVITLFGPESPRRFGSPSPRSVILAKELDCSPCVSAFNNRLSRCHDNRCMQQITVEDVFERACRILQG